MILTVQLASSASRRFAFARVATLGIVTSLAFTAAPSPVSAQSFLDGKSNGMVKCVRAILTGALAVDRQVKHVNVHGHHFNCKVTLINPNRPSDRRQIWLSHDQFGPDDQYVVDFRVDAQNVLVRETVKIGITKGVSWKSLKKPALYLDTKTAYLALLKDVFDHTLSVPQFRGPVTYDGIAELARAMSARKVKKWETAAFQIALVAIAEYGRSSRVRVPAPGQSTPAPTHNSPAPAQSGSPPGQVKQ